ncbi:uncharacterized protein LOC134694141 [Mytilus trossulus]|uniref:uncharacterized protein LOC134694141 n=1 Tax=Mytilus trossulus TaxID=6551 RepID=UPI003005B3C6
MADNKMCAGCLRDAENNSATSWCSDCSEPVCLTCSKFHKKLAPPHQIVPIKNVQSKCSEILDLSQNCSIHHDTRVSLYCCQHDQIICETCASVSHQRCKSIISVDKASKGVREGAAILDLEKRLGNLMKVLEKILSIQVNNEDDMKRSKDEIEINISEVKTAIIEHLNYLEAKQIKDLNEKYSKCQTLIAYNTQDAQSTLKSATTWKKDLGSFHPHASETQLFQAVKYLDAKTYELEGKVRQIQSTSLCKLQFCALQTLTNMKTIFPCLGIVLVQKAPAPETTDLYIDQQGQAIARSDDNKKQISPVSSFQTDIFGKDVTIFKGCFIPDGRLLLSSMSTNQLFICNLDGTDAQSIDLIYTPHSVALYDNSQALVTSRGGCYIQTINLTTLKPEKKIYIGRSCEAVTSLDGKICLSTSGNSLTMISLNGVVLKKTVTKFNPYNISINTAGDIYCTGQFGHVYVLLANNEEPVIYNEMSGGNGIAVGDHNSIFVAQYDLNLINKISSNGEVNSVENILNEDDGIILPTALSYDNETRHLMVVNDSRNSILVFKTW